MSKTTADKKIIPSDIRFYQVSKWDQKYQEKKVEQKKKPVVLASIPNMKISNKSGTHVQTIQISPVTPRKEKPSIKIKHNPPKRTVENPEEEDRAPSSFDSLEEI